MDCHLILHATPTGNVFLILTFGGWDRLLHRAKRKGKGIHRDYSHIKSSILIKDMCLIWRKWEKAPPIPPQAASLQLLDPWQVPSDGQGGPPLGSRGPMFSCTGHPCLSLALESTFSFLSPSGPQSPQSATLNQERESGMASTLGGSAAVVPRTMLIW